MISKYTIYGERHSGTKLLEQIISTHFDITLTWQYGWKHFFGQYKNTFLGAAKHVIFLCIVRNPYDWLAAMYNQPHHINKWYYNDTNSIINPFTSMEQFLTEPIISYTTPTIAYQYIDNSPEYFQTIEADTNINTHQPYNNIFELRKNKLQYLYRLKHLTKNYIVIQYEDLIKDYIKYVNILSNKFNLTLKTTDTIINIEKKQTYDLNSDITRIINDNIDWTTEKKIGYYKNEISI